MGMIVEKEVKKKVRKPQKAKKEFHDRSKVVMLVLVIFIFIVTVFLVILSNNHLKKEKEKIMTAYANNMATSFEKKISKYDYTLGNSQGVPNGDRGITYEILHNGKPCDSYLVVFMKENDFINTVALHFTALGGDKDAEHMVMMAYLVDALYDDIDVNEAGKLISQMLDSERINVDGYEWVLNTSGNEMTFMIMDEKFMEE